MQPNTGLALALCAAFLSLVVIVRRLGTQPLQDH